MKKNMRAIKDFLDTLTYDVLDPYNFIDLKRINLVIESNTAPLKRIQKVKEDSPDFWKFKDRILEDKLIVDFITSLFGADFSHSLANGNILFQNEEFVKFLHEINNYKDFLRGIQIGLEVNKRKNRRGKIFEDLVLTRIKSIIDNFSTNEGVKLNCYQQYKLKVNEASKTLDAGILIEKNLIIGVEINFYTTQGSKVTEIFNRAYIELQNMLRSIGADLLVVTDGAGWIRMRETLLKAFNRLDFICNLKQLDKMLEEMLHKKISDN